MGAVSFDECFREHFGRLVAFGEVTTSSREVARDLAQEAFVRLHRNWESVADYDDIGGWLRRVMANLLIDHHRSTGAERRAIESLGRHRLAEPADIRLGSEDWAALIAVLPPRQRVIVTLFYGEDRSVEQIAQWLDVSVNTVKSSLSKARNTIRRGMGADDD